MGRGIFPADVLNGVPDTGNGVLHVVARSNGIFLHRIDLSRQAGNADIKGAPRHADTDNLIQVVVQCHANRPAPLAAAHQPGFHNEAALDEFPDDIGDGRLF